MRRAISPDYAIGRCFGDTRSRTSNGERIREADSLLVQQILFPQTYKLIQARLPVLFNPSRILSLVDRLQHRLVDEQVGLPLQFEVVGIKLTERRSQLDS